MADRFVAIVRFKEPFLSKFENLTEHLRLGVEVGLLTHHDAVAIACEFVDEYLDSGIEAE